MSLSVQNSNSSRKNSYSNCHMLQMYVTFKVTEEISFDFSIIISYWYSIVINKRCEVMYFQHECIVGVPEKPFTAITLNNVKITATTGLEVRNAAVVVTGGTTMKVSSGSAYIMQS